MHMKILFISDVYFPRVNGVSTSIKTFMSQLETLGHTVDLIAPDYGQQESEALSIKRIAARSIYFDPEDRLMKYGEALKQLPELKKANYDIIHVNTPFVAHYLGLKLAKQLNIPCVETYHTFFEDYLHHYLPWIPKNMARGLARFISKKQCNAVDAIVVPSQPMLDVLRTYGVKLQANVIPTGLQAGSFTESNGLQFKQKYQIENKRPMLLYVGRVAFEKNIPFLFEMVKVLAERHPNVLLVVAGEGPAEKSLHQLAITLKIEGNVKFIGYLDRETELNACYKAADVFVFSSKSETQGLVLLEAMAQGTPVVAIAELGTASILVEGQGAMISPESTNAFSEKVAVLIEDHAKRDLLSQTAKSYALTVWSAKSQAERLGRFYQKTIERYNSNKSSLPSMTLIDQ
ncbi:MAG: 1,2-diacylglycerol 3-alpha-glucosyltransferase [Methylophilaceae bacterium]|jgi:1,2-diacylglycerol 3-alpha-glucosyltransferase